jgi:hypothetical protein
MDLAQEEREQLEKIAREASCDRSYECLQGALEKLREVEWAAGGEVLFCQDEEGWNCRNGMRFGQSTICQCPVRRYIASHYHR